MNYTFIGGRLHWHHCDRYNAEGFCYDRFIFRALMLTLIGFDVDAAFRSGPIIEIADTQRMLFAVRRFAQITAPPALNVIEPELPVTTGCACYGTRHGCALFYQGAATIAPFSNGVNPVFRGRLTQQTIHNLLGGHIAASTVFDQCEYVANALHSVFKAIKAMAANGTLFYVDDTTNRILQQEPVIKTRAGKQRVRTGVYSSVCLAITAAGQRLILFQTNVGHAGEWMEDILQGRDPQLDTPVIMSDALSANRVIGTPTEVALCNSHGRRNFAELSEQHPRLVLKVLQLYGQIWVNNTHCHTNALSDIERRDYHEEHSRPAMEQIRQLCEQQLASEQGEQSIVEPNSNLGKAMSYFIKHFDALSAFCRIPGAPIDNNESERALKLVIRGRNYVNYRIMQSDIRLAA